MSDSVEEKQENIQGKQKKNRTRNETWKVPRPKSQGEIWELNLDLRQVTNITRYVERGSI